MVNKKLNKSLEEDSKRLYSEYKALFSESTKDSDITESDNYQDLKEIYFSDLFYDLILIFEDYGSREIRLTYTGPSVLFGNNYGYDRLPYDEIIIELVNVVKVTINSFMKLVDDTSNYIVLDDPDNLEYYAYSQLSHSDIYGKISNDISEHFFT